jgi:hypothetical protein
MFPSEAASDDLLSICATQYSLKWQAVVNTAISLLVASKTDE